MECPYCHKEMREGAIPAERDQLRWCPREESSDWGIEDRKNSVLLSMQPIFAVRLTASWYCPDCRVVITPVPELKDGLDKLKEKWDGFTEKMKEKHAAAEERREEQQREKRSEERRKKDPWEVD